MTSGDLIVRMACVYPETMACVYPETMSVTPATFDTLPIYSPAVEKADPFVCASLEAVAAARESGYVRDDVLTIGTAGVGIGVVSYQVGGVVPDPVPHHVLTRIDCP